MGHELKVKRISGETKQLDCGNDAINKKIKDAYYADLLRQGYTYEISAENIVLGYYMLTFRKYSVNDWKTEESEYTSGLGSDYFTLHLQYIMIDKKYQHRGIGTAVLKQIILDAKKLSREWPIRYLTLEAVADKYEWYKNNGFIAMDSKKITEGTFEIEMFLDCMDDRSCLDEYISSFI